MLNVRAITAIFDCRTIKDIHGMVNLLPSIRFCILFQLGIVGYHSLTGPEITQTQTRSREHSGVVGIIFKLSVLRLHNLRKCVSKP